jgi:hypothetical protein
VKSTHPKILTHQRAQWKRVIMNSSKENQLSITYTPMNFQKAIVSVYQYTSAIWEQGCQIFLYLIYQNVEKYTKLPLNYQMAIKYTI